MQTIDIKKYEDINTNIKNWLEDIVKDDPYGLSAKTLYYNIYNSVGDVEMLSKIFEVPIGLIRIIKKQD